MRALLGVLLLVGCATRARPLDLPASGITEVVLDEHLPGPLRIANVAAVLDGELVYRKTGGVPPRTSVFREHLPEGDHTLLLNVQIHVPCGLLAEPHETLTVKGTRSFEVGPSGGLVHADVFVVQPWLDAATAVRLLTTLHGMREGRWIYGRSEEAKQKCGGLSRAPRARCVVEQLVDQSRRQRDVVALLCHNDKLVQIDAVIALLPESDVVRRALQEARIEELQQQAEQCVGEDLAFVGSQHVTWEGGRCAEYDDRIPQ